MELIVAAPGYVLSSPLTDTEIVSVSFPRQLPVAGSTPVEQTGYPSRLPQIVENCIIHDVIDNGWWAFAPGAGLAGRLFRCIVYNVGWRGTDRDHGHGGYFQNYADSTRLIEQCIFLAGFSTPFKIYASGNEHKDELTLGFLSMKNKSANYTVRDTIVVGYECFIGTESRWGAHNIRIENCVYLDAVLRMGYKGQNGDGWIVDSLLVGGMNTGIFDRREVGRTYLDSRGLAVSWRNLTVTGNTFVLPGTATVTVNLPGAAPDWQWDYNEYWSDSPTPFNVVVDTGTDYVTHSNLSFDAYRELTGFDEHSTFRVGQPAASLSKIYPGWGGASWGPVQPPLDAMTSWYPPPPVLYDWPDTAPSLAPIRSEIAIWSGEDRLEITNWKEIQDLTVQNGCLLQDLMTEQALRLDSEQQAAIREAKLVDSLATATAMNLAVMDAWKAIDRLFLRAEVGDDVDFGVEFQAAVEAIDALTPYIEARWYGGQPPEGIEDLVTKIEQLNATLTQLQTDAAAVIDELTQVSAELTEVTTENTALYAAFDAFVAAFTAIREPVMGG